MGMILVIVVGGLLAYVVSNHFWTIFKLFVMVPLGLLVLLGVGLYAHNWWLTTSTGGMIFEGLGAAYIMLLWYWKAHPVKPNEECKYLSH
jgi:disulfide bond formation protein DsbB